ncbi:hypothetical protein Godav_010296 [Gossypium davidsonii]|uniref:Uncharacterized protein n=1 Tax=Gossypium davidsonii TaxID=34287 RepID=A0A7J8SFZ5_GOSDV|nr:hypothetical protein [Gossypium davidsonii]
MGNTIPSLLDWISPFLLVLLLDFLVRSGSTSVFTLAYPYKVQAAMAASFKIGRHSLKIILYLYVQGSYTRLDSSRMVGSYQTTVNCSDNSGRNLELTNATTFWCFQQKIRERRGRGKNSASTRVPLTDSMSSMAKLISSQIQLESEKGCLKSTKVDREGVVFCKRLDRAIGNYAWLASFLNCSVTHLSRLNSDHKPLFVSLRPQIHSPLGRSFCFLAGRVEHIDFTTFVKDNWAFTVSMSTSISNFASLLKD